MNQDIKDLWVTALTDGSYHKGSFQLRDLDDHFDAVGVLMDLAVQQGVIAEPRKHSKATGAQLFFGYSYDKEVVAISKTVAEWAGLSRWQANRVLTVNDNSATFDKVADYIKGNL